MQEFLRSYCPSFVAPRGFAEINLLDSGSRQLPSRPGSSRLVATPYAQARRDEISRNSDYGKLDNARITPAGTKYSAYGAFSRAHA